MPEDTARTQWRIPRADLVGALLMIVIPVIGVMAWGWDAYEIMFVLSWEVILTSFALMWLFNYPERCALAGIGLAFAGLPVGLLMWLVLDMSYEEARFSGMIAHFFSVTWLALAVIAANVFFYCRKSMAEAQLRGASIRSNNRILLRWLYSVFLPFFVFAILMAGWKSMNVGVLLGVLMAKAMVDVFIRMIEHNKLLRLKP